jgi:hypothetical protein
MQAGVGHTTPILTAHGEALLKVCPTDEVKVARKISFHDSLGYEIITYDVKKPGGHNSSFSPEDLCSNNLGTVIAEKAINSILQSPKGKTFNGEVTKILPDILNTLDAQSAAESQKAFNLVNGRWVSYTNSGSLLFDSYLKRRNFSHIPWKAGHSSDSAAPSWLVDDPILAQPYTYTNTAGRKIKDTEFLREIDKIRDDAKATYGADYDKP